jgi:hypothetical protein
MMSTPVPGETADTHPGAGHRHPSAAMMSTPVPGETADTYQCRTPTVRQRFRSPVPDTGILELIT